MRLVAANQAFSFNYTDPYQRSGIFVAFRVYDVTSGTAVFLSQVTGVYSAFGSYMASYTPASGKSYLVVGLVYTDGSYATVDVSSPPTADVYSTLTTFLGVSYASYDQSATLAVRGTVYDVSSGSPASPQTVSMSYVEHGVYFGSMTGVTGKTYDALGVVYTDGTFTTPDTTRAPSSDEFDCIILSSGGGSFLGPGKLTGQLLTGSLYGSQLSGILRET